MTCWSARSKTLAIVPDLDGAIPEIKTNVWPAYPTDLISIAITVATQATGSVLFHDWMYSGRMYFTDKLVSMGARIILCDPYRCLVQGRTPLFSEKLESPDIRAGMALRAGGAGCPGQLDHPQHQPDRSRLRKRRGEAQGAGRQDRESRRVARRSADAS